MGWRSWLRTARIVLASAALVVSPAASPLSQAFPRRPDIGCTADGGTPVRIVAIGDDFTLGLADGRVARLAGIDPAGATAVHPTLARDARSLLSNWLVGRQAILRSLDADVDRWGRTAALVFAPVPNPRPQAPIDSPPLSVALALVDAGLARGRVEPGLHACWAAVAAAESGARAAGLGLWSDPYYAVRKADDMASNLADLTGLPGHMVLVEGRVRHVGRGRSRLYIRLGGPEAEVTLSLAKRNVFILGQLGLDDTRLVGVELRARGLLDDRIEPSIEIDELDQVEVLGSAPAPGSAAAGRER